MLLSPAPALAQVSAPDLLGSQFSGDNQTVSGQLRLLAPLRGPTPPPGLTVGMETEKTVHTTRAGVGVLEDLHADSRFESLRLTFGKSPSLPEIVLDDRELDNGGVLDEQGPSGTTLTANGHEEQPEIGLRWTARGATLTLSAARDAYHARGFSSVYDGVFSLFTRNPPYTYIKNRALYSADLSLPVTHTLALEAVAGWETAPGALTLQNSQAEISAPLDDEGARVMAAARWQPTRRISLAAYTDDGEFGGSGSVDVTGNRAVGAGQSRRSEFAQGLGVQCTLRGGRLTLFDEYRRTRWNISGSVPDPADLGVAVTAFGFNLLQNGTYHALYQVSTQSFGLHWDRASRAGHFLSLEGRRIRLDPDLEAGYGAQILAAPVTGMTSFTPGPQWGELLQARYQFPWLHLIQDIRVSQILPDLSHGHGGSSGGSSSSVSGPTQAPRETSGGWALSWSIERQF